MLENKLKNIVGITFIILFLYLFYTNISIYSNIFNIDIHFNFSFLHYFGLFLYKDLNFYINFLGNFFGNWGILNYFVFFYWFGFVLFYSFWVKKTGKPVYFWMGVWNVLKKMNPINFNKNILDQNEKKAILNILVKSIFIPLMFFWFFTNLSGLINSISNMFLYGITVNDTFFTFYYKHLHFLFYNFIFWLDVTIFLFGYCIELDFLNNKIKSVEPTLLGWISALACYPILNTVTGYVLGWYSSNMSDFVHYLGDSNVYYILTTVIGVFSLFLLAIYVWASFALGAKASNLTNRGIVFVGPYAFVRHPAYFAKNLFRLVGALPLLINAFIKSDIKLVLFVVFSLIGWFFIYHIRALTEERHLSADKEYLQYMKRVKYMYIPFIL